MTTFTSTDNDANLLETRFKALPPMSYKWN